MKAIDKILEGKTDNCLFPFFWLVGDETESSLKNAVDRVYESGARALCVEPRGFSTFAKDWWRMLDIILERAEKHGMKVLVVDEDTVPPTGHAYGLVAKKGNEHLRKISLVEAHTDVFGPREIDLVVGETSPYRVTENHDELIEVFAYKRTDSSDGIDINSGVKLTDRITDGILSWNVPDGAYRIVYVYKTLKYTEIFHDDFIDFLNKDSVDLLINNIYDDYEKRYGHLFGKTFAGFFSDEPAIGNNYMFDPSNGTNAYENTRIGTVNQTIAYTDEVKKRLDDAYGFDCSKLLPALWYYDENVSPLIRNRYMNVISELYRENFSERLGAWCKERGLAYVGHVLEDNNLHCRSGHGAGHYFRSQQGQSMPGIDIVLHQVIPGASEYKMNGSGDHLMDGEFYHYILGKLNSSAAYTYPQYNGMAMCEVTIGYGWAEGSRTVKWLMDYLLVRGTNYFVPGAVRPTFPDDMHAPHFGADDGQEPQFKGITDIFGYVNKASMVLRGKHVSTAAILYHAQAEWMNDKDYMYIQKPAKQLTDNHIDFDILCEDLLSVVKIKGKKIDVNGAEYDCLVVPYAKLLPSEICESLFKIKTAGGKVVFVDGLPINTDKTFEVVKLDFLAEYFNQNGYRDIKLDGCRLLRHTHFKNGDEDIFMFFNESVTETYTFEVETGVKGNCNLYDFACENYSSVKNGEKLSLRLEPYQSVIAVYEKERGFEEYKPYTELNVKDVVGDVNVTLTPCDNGNKIRYAQSEMVAVSKKYPTFSGTITYDGEFVCDKTRKATLRFEKVGENAELYVNDKYCGMRVCPPYVFDVTSALKEGKNQYRLLVRTTLANSRRDKVSMYLPLEPTGAHGKVELFYE